MKPNLTSCISHVSLAASYSRLAGILTLTSIPPPIYQAAPNYSIQLHSTDSYRNHISCDIVCVANDYGPMLTVLLISNTQNE